MSHSPASSLPYSLARLRDCSPVPSLPCALAPSRFQLPSSHESALSQVNLDPALRTESPLDLKVRASRF
eukprot:1513416-Pleurochrysis_carterae.AAC.3